MRLLLTSPLFYFIFNPILCNSQQLQCYHCINRLPTTDITIKERNALKTALFTRFNIPPSNEYCIDGGNELLFRTIPKETCQGINDTCVRIISEGDENKKLVLRGCLSTMGKPGFELFTNHSCHRDSEETTYECITTCQEPLCNNSHEFNLIPSLLIAIIYLVL